MKMRQKQVTTLVLHATYLVASLQLAAAQLLTSTTTLALPPHTVIYSTTHGQNEAQPQAITTVVVTILMPRTVGYLLAAPGNNAGQYYLLDGWPVTGTATSHFRAPQANGDISMWSETAELYWTLTNWIRTTTDTSTTPLEDAKTTLSTAWTTSSSFTTDVYGPWVTHAHSTINRTARTTFVEVVGTAYPATIVRTGFTHIDATATGGPVQGATHTVSDTATWVSTTTLVQVSARPTSTPLLPWMPAAGLGGGG